MTRKLFLLCCALAALLCMPLHSATSENETWWPEAPVPAIEWPETSSPGDMAHLLAEASWYFYLKFWNEDYSENRLEKTSPFSIMFPPYRQRKWEEYASTIRRRLPELLPHWIWIGPLLGEIRPVVYRLSPDKSYRIVGDAEAERLLQRTTYFFDAPPPYPSCLELAQWIYNGDNTYDLHFYTKTGEDISSSIVVSEFFLPYDRADMPRTLEALKRLRPKYMGYASELMINNFYILQRDGSYAFGSDAVSEILDTRMNVPPVYNDDEPRSPAEEAKQEKPGSPQPALPPRSIGEPPVRGRTNTDRAAHECPNGVSFRLFSSFGDFFCDAIRKNGEQIMRMI